MPYQHRRAAVISDSHWNFQKGFSLSAEWNWRWGEGTKSWQMQKYELPKENAERKNLRMC